MKASRALAALLLHAGLAAAAPFTGTAVSLPSAAIKAGNFETGGEAIACHDIYWTATFKSRADSTVNVDAAGAESQTL
jgi:hypothetical protein